MEAVTITIEKMIVAEMSLTEMRDEGVDRQATEIALE